MSTRIASSSSFPQDLYTATIILYAPLIIATIFVWRKHGRPGFLGWNYLYGFCGLRIAGSALSITAASDPGLETAASIVNSMAVSPLILAALGLLHEARRARDAGLESRKEWLRVGVYHVVVSVAIALVIVGIVNMMEGKPHVSLIRTGLALLVIAYSCVAVWACKSLRRPDYTRRATVFDGTRLLHSVVLALPLVGMRLVYGVVSFLLTDPSFSTNLAAKIVLSEVPELLTAVFFVVAGYMTKDMYVVEEKIAQTSEYSGF